MLQSYDKVLSEASQKRTAVFSFSKTYPAYIILGIGIIASIGVWYAVKQKLEADRKASFEKAMTSIVSRIENGYREHEQVLRSIYGLYDGYIQVVRDVFELYASIPTKTYPSILSANYISYVPAEKKEEFIFYVQSERYYNYNIYPAGQRPEYFPIEYVVSFEKNVHRSGLDLATDSVVMQTFRQAKQKNGFTATPFFNVRPDTMGFMLMAPVLKTGTDAADKNLDGMVVLEIHANSFLINSLGNSTATDTIVTFQCIAATGAKGQEQVVYSSRNFAPATSEAAQLTETKTISIADKKIHIRFQLVPQAGGAFQEMLPLLSLIGSLLISSTIFAFVLSTTTSRTRALDLADRMTRSQRRIVDSSKDIIAVMDINGIWRTMNPASIAMLGYYPQEITGKNITDLFIDSQDIALFKRTIEKAQDEVAIPLDVEMSTKTGDRRWVSWNFTVSHTDGLIYCVGRDVTIQKMAEDQIKLKNKQVELAEQFALEASEFKSGFMTRLGHQLRNSLTGIMGYLQLLSQELFQTKEEELAFIDMAQKSSEELYTIVADMLEIAERDVKESSIQLQQTSFQKTLALTRKNLAADENTAIIRTSEEDVVFIGDQQLLANALSELVNAVTYGLESPVVELLIQSNGYEQTAEIQIIAPVNSYASRMISLIKEKATTIIEALATDNHTVLFRLALASSFIRRMNGTITFEAMEEEGNIIMITLPLKKEAHVNV